MGREKEQRKKREYFWFTKSATRCLLSSFGLLSNASDSSRNPEAAGDFKGAESLPPSPSLAWVYWGVCPSGKRVSVCVFRVQILYIMDYCPFAFPFSLCHAPRLLHWSISSTNQKRPQNGRHSIPHLTLPICVRPPLWRKAKEPSPPSGHSFWLCIRILEDFPCPLRLQLRVRFRFRYLHRKLRS